MAFKLPRKIAERFSKDIGIDLGTATSGCCGSFRERHDREDPDTHHCH
ncbi:MAG: hypothetical protein Greene07147_663 [Parcubacteria group bacterium Greene0714_7]|nr:MAG: hypothetical protein Greene07147_663 [Parcubacteria group bacterium Greene0714_7]